VQLVTLGQRRGIGAGPDGERRYVVGVDLVTNTVEVAALEAALSDTIEVEAASVTTTGRALPIGETVIVQVSAHGRPLDAKLIASPSGFAVQLGKPARLVASGQTLAFYDPLDPDVVLGSAIVQ
ncbi:MAG: aminomethyltransferase beta-barrel domain-containing protein, partial [Actinomycetota bacterium]